MKILLLIPLMFLSSCGTAWIVRQDLTGGVIAYKNYNSGDSIRSAIKGLAHCPNIRIVADELVEGGSSTIYSPMQSTNYSSGTFSNNRGPFMNYSGQQTQTQYVPINIRNVFRQATYECVGG